VLAVAFHPEGRWVITSSRDRRLRIWDVETGKLVPELRPQTLAEPLRNLDFLPDGSLLAGAGLDGAAHLVDLTRPERPIRSLQMGPSAGKIVQVVCLPGSRRLACVNGNGTVYLLDLDRQTEREDRLGWVNGVEIVAPSK
jgi:WD40 repeat protein